MQIQIETTHLDGASAARERLEQRVRFVLRRLREQIRHARISLSDVNGPRGGVDMQCRVALRTEAHGTLVVTAQADNPVGALDRALQRVARMLLRQGQRRRRPQRLRPELSVADPEPLPA